MNGDDQDDSGKLHRRGHGYGSQLEHDGSHAETSPATPGKATLTQRLPFAAPQAAARTTVRGAVGAARQVASWVPQLTASVAAGDYAESGRLSFEIRSALRRAEAALADLERKQPGADPEIAEGIATARSQLVERHREAAALLRAAPVFEAAGAASEESERAWKAERARGAGSASGQPTWDTDAAALGASLGLGAIAIHTGDDARQATEAEGANGIALRGSVYLHSDRIRPGTPDGREVLAHELVHLAQARLSPEQDGGRAAAEHEAADIARVLASGGTAPRPTRYIDLDRAAADIHAKAQVPSGTVDARGYIDRTGNAVRINEAIIAEVGALALPDPPAARLTWKDSAPFRARLQRVLARVIGGAAKSGDLAARLVDLAYPVSVLDALDAVRFRNKEQPVKGKVLGPDTWQDAAGRAIADVVATAISESVVRLGAQYVKTVDDADRRRADDGWETAYVLVPSHPMDEHVSAALLGDDQGKSILAVAPAETSKPRRRGKQAADSKVERGWRAVTVHWMGKTDPSLWNWLRVEPADATAEEVSAALYDGDTAHATWLTAAPPYYALHPERAARIQAASTYRPADADAVAADAADNRSMGALATSIIGDDAARAQGAGVELAKPSEKAARAEAESALDDTDKQLAYLTEALTPWGLIAELQPAWTFEQRCRAALATATGADATSWARAAVAQRTNLFEVSGAVAGITRAATPQGPGAIHDLLADYARAAGAAHLAATGRALLDKALRRQARLASDAALQSAAATRASVSNARDATEASDQAAAARSDSQAKVIADLPDMWRDAAEAMFAADNQGDVSRADMRRERDDLTRASDALDGQVRQIRADAIAGKPTDADAVDEALLRSDEIAFRARVRAIRLRVRELEREAHTLDKGLMSKVVDLVDGQISGIEGFSGLVRIALDGAVAKLDIKRSTVHQDLSASQERQARRDALVAAQQEIERVGGMSIVSTFMNAAARIIQKHQFRVALLNLAVMIGVGIAGAAIGGVVAQQVVGAEAATGLVGTAVTVGTEALVNTVAGGVLNGHDVTFQTFIENAIAGAASRLIMHPFASGAGGKALGSFERNIWKQTGTRLALAKGVEIGAEAVLQIAVNYTAAKAARLGEPPSQMSVDDWMIEGLGIALGRFIHGRVQRMQSRLKDIPDDAARQLEAESAALAAAARKLEAAPNEATARTLLDRAQALADREQAVLAARVASATGDAKTRAADAAQTAKDEAARDQGEMANLAFGVGGFREVVPGTIYEGSPTEILRIVENAESLGIEIVGHDQATGRWTMKREGRVIHIDEARAADHQQRVVLAGAEMNMVARAAVVKGKPGVLDVFLHGSVDDFIIKTSDGPVRINHRSLATAIRKSGAKYQRIRLIACSSGRHPKGVAQHLANILGVPVEAPSDAVHIHKDGTLTIGPREDRDTGHWIEYRPQPAELRSKPAAEPQPSTPRERLEQRRAGRAYEMGDGAADVGHVSEAARRAVAEEVGSIPVAHVKAGTWLPGSPESIKHDTYFVTPADGERMIAALAKLPDVSTRTFKKGFIVRWGASEWYFEYRSDAGAAAVDARAGQAGPLGLPQANAASIEIWGFRGVRKIHGRDKSQWTPEEAEAVAKARKTDPLMYAGHVGISFDGGATIYGFLPDRPADIPKESFLDYLLQHHAVAGKVDDDTPIFRRAENHAKEEGWSTGLMSVVELVDTAEKAAAINGIMQMKSGNHDKGYQMPLPEAVNGSFYQDSNGYAAENLANCAAFPPMVGVRIPEVSGNLHSYMPELTSWAAADGPIDFRSVTPNEQAEEP